MKKVSVVLFLILFSAVLSAEGKLSDKTWDIYATDMPEFTVDVTKAVKKKGRLHEAFNEEKEVFQPSAADKARGFAVYTRHTNDDIFPTMVPHKDELKPAYCFGAAGEKVNTLLLIYPLLDLKAVKLEPSDLLGPGGKKIAKENVEISQIKYDYEADMYNDNYLKAKHVMIGINEAPCRKEVPRPFWIKVTVPSDAAGGTYKGKLAITGGLISSEAEISVEVFPFPVENPGDDCIFGTFTYLAADAFPKLITKTCEDLNRHDMNVFHGGIGNALTYTAGGVTIDFSNMDKNAESMRKYGIKKWVLELTGLPVTFADKLHCRMYDGTFTRAYKGMLTELKTHAEKNKWPELLIMYDEPRENDPGKGLARTYDDIEALLKIHNDVKLYALPTFMNDDGGKKANGSGEANYFQLCKFSKYNMTHGWSQSEKIMKETVKSGNTLYLYNCGFGRFEYGFLTYRLGARGNMQFWYTSGSDLSTQAQFPLSYAVSTVGVFEGAYTPVLRYLRSVEGEHDFWYIMMLEKALNGAKDKKSADAIAAGKLLNEIKTLGLGTSTAAATSETTFSQEALKDFTGAKFDEYRYKMGQLIAKLK